MGVDLIPTPAAEIGARSTMPSSNQEAKYDSIDVMFLYTQDV